MAPGAPIGSTVADATRMLIHVRTVR